MKQSKRAAWATGLSLLLHVLALTGMVVGLRVVQPPPEQRAMDVTLVPPIDFKPRPQKPQPAAERAAPTPLPILKPHIAPRVPPQAPPAVPTTPAPATPAPAPAKPEGPARVYGPVEGSGGGSTSGKLGCDDFLGFHLTGAQRETCLQNLARLGKNANPIDLIPADKLAEYERYSRCRETYKDVAGVPLGGAAGPGQVESGARGSNINPLFNTNAGLRTKPKGC